MTERSGLDSSGGVLEEVRSRRASRTGTMRPLEAFRQAILASFDDDFGLADGW